MPQTIPRAEYRSIRPLGKSRSTAERLLVLEKENARLERAVAMLRLENMLLQETLEKLSYR